MRARERHPASVRHAMRAVQDPQSACSIACAICPMSRCCTATSVAGVAQDAGSVSVEVRGPEGTKTHRGAYVIGADGGRSTVRKQCRHRVRRLHLAGALHRVDHAVRFRGALRLFLSQLFRRPRRMVQLLQGLRRRPARPVAHRLSGRSVAERGRHPERQRRAGAHPVVLSVRQTLRDRASQYLRHASARRRDVSQGPGAARRRLGACQQSDRRHGAQRRHQDAANLADKLSRVLVGGEPDSCSISTTCSGAPSPIEFVQEQSIANKKRLEASDPKRASRTSTNCAPWRPIRNARGSSCCARR